MTTFYLFWYLVLPSLIATCCCFRCTYCRSQPPYYRKVDGKLQYLCDPPEPLCSCCENGLNICCFTFDKPVVSFTTWYLSEHTIIWIVRPHLHETLGLLKRIFCTIFVLIFIFLFETVWKKTILPDNQSISDLPALFKSSPTATSIILATKVVASTCVTMFAQTITKVVLRMASSETFLSIKQRSSIKRKIGIAITLLGTAGILSLFGLCIWQIYSYHDLTWMDETTAYLFWMVTTLITSNFVPVKYVLYRLYGTIGKPIRGIEQVYVSQYGYNYVQRKEGLVEAEEPLLNGDEIEDVDY